MTRDDVIAAARRYLGVPYRKRGRSAHGLDCLGLIILIGRDLHVPHEDELDYSIHPSPDFTMLKRLAKYCIQVPPDTPKPGLIGTFAESRLPGHIGVFSSKYGRDHLIHARIRPGRVIEESWDQIPHHQLRMVAMFAIPGMEL